MDESLTILEAKFEKLIEEETQPLENELILQITEKTQYSNKFVSFVINSISHHYSDMRYLLHIVKYVAEETKNVGIDPKCGKLSAPAFNKIGQICKQLKDDSVFSLDFEQVKYDWASEFTLLTRFAIIATYCASYNPQNTDGRFFFMGRDIFKRKSRAGMFAKKREKCHEIGPRQVEHQRALFIYLYFCKTFEHLFDTEDIDLAIDFTSQIRILEEAGLLKVVSAHDNFDLPMYVSMCTLDFVKQIASTITPDGLNLERDYLFDFATD